MIAKCFRLFLSMATAVVMASTASVAGWDGYHGGGHGAGGTASTALAHLNDDGKVVVRQFVVGFFPENAPGKNGAKRPGEETVSLQGKGPAPVPLKMTTREFRLRFNAKDIQVFGLDGKRVDAAAWQKRLKKETPVLFTGFAGGGYAERAPDPKTPWAGRQFVSLVAAADEPPANPPKIDPILARVYRKDALVLFATKPPVERKSLVPKGAAPQGPPPQFGEAFLDGKTLRVRQKFRNDFVREVTVLVKDKDGKARPVRATVKHSSEVVNTREVDAALARVFDVAGKQLELEQAADKLAKGAPVVISSDGGTVDSFYLRLVRPGTVVVSLPQVSGPPPVPQRSAPIAPPPAPN